MRWIDKDQLRDAKTMSEAQYFIKYGEHPLVIIQQAEERSQ